MPILTQEEYGSPISIPDGGCEIARYMDFAKFVSLLKSRSLFMCRVDKFEDPFEGTYTAHSLQSDAEYLQGFAQQVWNTELSDEQLQNNSRQLLTMAEEMTRRTFVQSWNLHTAESAALWKIYTADGMGVMIRSNVQRLNEVLSDEPLELLLTSVSYVDYRTDTIPTGNVLFPVMFKQNAYQYEKEVRLLHIDRRPQLANMPVGKVVMADPNVLVEEVFVSPFAPNWFFELVSEIASDYGLTCNVSMSTLSSANVLRQE